MKRSLEGGTLTLRIRFALAATLTFLAFGRGAFAVPLTYADYFAGPRATFGAARDLLLAHIDAAKGNSDDAYDIVTRFATATHALDGESNDPRVLADETIHANLDLAWARAITTGVCMRPAPTGPSETCFRSSIDRTLQPLAVYVPASLVAGKTAPVVVALRGRGSTETELLSLSDLRDLADRTHVIVVAPYARGEATYDRSATQDVLDALDATATFASTDSKRTYIAGFSMGGFAAFHVAGVAPSRFAGLLSIVGAINPVDRDAIAGFDRPIYVVNAERDTVVTPEHGRESVAFLRAHGHSARYYEQKDGVHSLRSVLPAVSDAWHDMLDGITTTNTLAPADREAAPGFAVPSGPATQLPTQGRPT